MRLLTILYICSNNFEMANDLQNAEENNINYWEEESSGENCETFHALKFWGHLRGKLVLLGELQRK